MSAIQEGTQATPGAVVKTRSTIPYTWITKEIIKECLQKSPPSENNKKNKAAQGTTVWLKWDLKKFRNFFPEEKFRLNEQRLTIRTPYMEMPFGISRLSPTKPTITLSFGAEMDDRVEAFEKWCKEVFDPALREIIVENSKKWLGKEYTMETVTEIYNGIFKHSEEDIEKGYEAKTPGFKIMDVRTCSTRAQHGKGNPIPIDDDHIQKRDFASLKIQLSTIWILKPRIGISGVIDKIDVRTPAEMNNPGFAINLAPTMPAGQGAGEGAAQSEGVGAGDGADQAGATAQTPEPIAAST